MVELIRPILTVDIVLLTLKNDTLHTVLLRRDREPFEGRSALVGGYVHPEEDKTSTDAAFRVVKSKARTTPRILEQLMTFSGGTRDPRGWSASVAYLGLTPIEQIPSSNLPSLEIIAPAKVRDMPFDHRAILAMGVERLKRKASYSTLPAFLLDEAFTLSALRNAYQIALGRHLNDSAFRRKIDDLRIIEPVSGAFSRVSARPAQLYRLRTPRVTEFNLTI